MKQLIRLRHCTYTCSNEIEKKWTVYLTDSSFSFQKLYAVCDIALGLLVSKATNITLKDSNVEPVLPAKCFVKQAKVDKSHIHVHCMFGFTTLLLILLIISILS